MRQSMLAKRDQPEPSLAAETLVEGYSLRKRVRVASTDAPEKSFPPQVEIGSPGLPLQNSVA